MMLLIDNTGGIDYITVLRQYLDFVCFDNQLILKIVSKKQKNLSAKTQLTKKHTNNNPQYIPKKKKKKIFKELKNP